MIEITERPFEPSAWTPEEEARIAEIIAGFSAAEISRIESYSTLRLEAIRRMRYEQMRNAPLPVVRIEPARFATRPTELMRDRRFGRPRKYDSSAARQRAYRQRQSGALRNTSVAA